MRRYPVRLSEQFVHNLRALREHIAQDNDSMAEVVVRSIMSSIEGHLSYFPESGQQIDEQGRIFVESTFRYRILYDFDGTIVSIIDVGKYRNR